MSHVTTSETEITLFQPLKSFQNYFSDIEHVDTRAFCRRTKSLNWNSLPGHLWDPAVDSEQFRRDLKTYLFVGHLKRLRIKGVTQSRSINRHLLTYLLTYLENIHERQ